MLLDRGRDAETAEVRLKIRELQVSHASERARSVERASRETPREKHGREAGNFRPRGRRYAEMPLDARSNAVRPLPRDAYQHRPAIAGEPRERCGGAIERC